MNVQPPFSEYHFIDLDGGRAENLRQLAGNDPSVHVYNGDCNQVLRSEVFTRARYRDFHRGLCLLDPYALNLDWEVIQAAGQMQSIEIFLNFMVMDMNMNVLWKNPDNVSPSQLARMDAFWGDRSWRRYSISETPRPFAGVRSGGKGLQRGRRRGVPGTSEEGCGL